LSATTIKPPKGYSSWLDYAVATMDTRSALLDMSGLCGDDDVVDPVPSRDDMRVAAQAELAALRSGQ
jgi:hypothetical protein